MPKINTGHSVHRAKQRPQAMYRMWRQAPNVTSRDKEKIIYLDQFAISDMMKALNPNMPSHAKVRDSSSWPEIFETIEKARRAQLIACPSSSEHDLESMLSPFYGPLKLLYDYLSWGLSFDDSETIKRRQIFTAAKAWISDTEPQYDLNAEQVIEGALHDWTDHFLIYAKGQYPSFVEDIKRERADVGDGIANLFYEWQKQPTRAFKDFYDELIRSYGDSLLESVAQWQARYARMAKGLEPVSLAALPPEAADTLHYIKTAFRNAGVKPEDMAAKVRAFFASNAIQTVPFLRISCSMYASIARKAISGQKNPPNDGTSTDITMVSTLLPYCDAMLIDSPCASLLSDIPKDRRLPYKAMVFTYRTRGDFLSYLREIVSQASEDHIDAVRATYGEDWARPRLDLMQGTEPESQT